jgi:hypothetical protein
MRKSCQKFRWMSFFPTCPPTPTRSVRVHGWSLELHVREHSYTMPPSAYLHGKWSLFDALLMDCVLMADEQLLFAALQLAGQSIKLQSIGKGYAGKVLTLSMASTLSRVRIVQWNARLFECPRFRLRHFQGCEWFDCHVCASFRQSIPMGNHAHN